MKKSALVIFIIFSSVCLSCRSNSYSTRHKLASQYWYGHENQGLIDVIYKKSMADPQLQPYSDIIYEYTKANLKGLDDECIVFFADSFTTKELEQLIKDSPSIQRKYKKIYPDFEATMMKRYESRVSEPSKLNEFKTRISKRKEEISNGTYKTEQ